MILVKDGAVIYFVLHYALFFCIFLDFLNVNQKVRHSVLIALVVMITLFGGLRWKIGGDWSQYFYHFNHINFENFLEYHRFDGRIMEFGYTFITAVLKYLFGTFWMYNLITTGIIQFVRYKVCKALCGPYALTTYCTMMLLSSNYFSVRSGLGMGVALASFYFIKKRALKGFVLTNLTSYFIHVQGIVMFPFYWIGYVKLNWKVFIGCLILLSLFGYVFQAQFVSLASSFEGSSAGSVAAHYAGQYETVSDGSRAKGISTIMMNLFFSFLFLFVRKKRNLEKDVWFNGLLNMFLVQTAIYMVFSDGMSDICRIAGLLIFAKILLMLESVKYFKECGKKWQYYAVLFFYGMYLISKINSLDSGYYFYSCNVPYRTIFDYGLI